MTRKIKGEISNKVNPPPTAGLRRREPMLIGEILRQTTMFRMREKRKSGNAREQRDQ